MHDFTFGDIKFQEPGPRPIHHVVYIPLYCVSFFRCSGCVVDFCIIGKEFTCRGDVIGKVVGIYEKE